VSTVTRRTVQEWPEWRSKRIGFGRAGKRRLFVEEGIIARFYMSRVFIWGIFQRVLGNRLE
jgi:hypothetical protein